jgi:hypothetical protein
LNPRWVSQRGFFIFGAWRSDWRETEVNHENNTIRKSDEQVRAAEVHQALSTLMQQIAREIAIELQARLESNDAGQDASTA